MAVRSRAHGRARGRVYSCPPSQAGVPVLQVVNLVDRLKYVVKEHNIEFTPGFNSLRPDQGPTQGRRKLLKLLKTSILGRQLCACSSMVSCIQLYIINMLWQTSDATQGTKQTDKNSCPWPSIIVGHLQGNFWEAEMSSRRRCSISMHFDFIFGVLCQIFLTLSDLSYMCKAMSSLWI